MIEGLTSIIVVSADSGACLRDGIDRALASSVDVEIIVFDNASGDGWPQQVMAAHAAEGRLRWIANPTNIGFGPACNRAVAVARGDVLLFVNPDCLLESDSAERLRAALLQSRARGVVGALVVDAHSMSSRGSQRRDPTLRRSLSSLSGLSRLQSRWPSLEGIEMPTPSTGHPQEPVAVDAISGACFVIRHALYTHLGGFDEAYFLHCEDLDLCRRVRDEGYAVMSDPSTKVIHRQGSSSRHRAAFVARHKHRGMWLWFTRFDPAARNPLLRALVWCGIWLHFGVVRMRHRFGVAGR